MTAPDHTPSKYTAVQFAKSLVKHARSAIRQGIAATSPSTGSAPAAPKAATAPASLASQAAAAALKEASASGKLGCPKCRYATYGCKKCRAAYVKNTGISIPVDRSLHADIFSMIQPAAECTGGAPLPRQQTSAGAQKLSATQECQAGINTESSSGKAMSAGIGSTAAGKVQKASKERQKAAATGHGTAAAGQQVSPDTHSLSRKEARSGKRSASQPPEQDAVPKKQKTAAAHTLARSPARAVTGNKGALPAGSPALGRDQAGLDFTTAKRSRLSRQPAAETVAATASNLKPSTAGKAAALTGRKPDSNAKPAAQSTRPSSVAPKSEAKSGTTMTAAPGSHAAARALLLSSARGHPKTKEKASAAKAAAAAAEAPSSKASRKKKLVVSPKTMTAAKIRQTPSAKVASATGSALLHNLESKLGCSKCRFVASGCSRCRGKQAGSA